MARADKFTPLNKKPIYYSDFQNNLDLNPITDQIAVNTNEVAVANAIKNLVLTNPTERPYHPHIGGKVQSLLFEPMDNVTADLIQSAITNTIQSSEPRAQLRQVTVTPDDADNQYYVTVVFTIINISQPITISFPLRRVR